MHYFIYRITRRPIRQLAKLEQHESYREASARVKLLRSELPDAETELHAEDLLNQVREASPEPGDD